MIGFFLKRFPRQVCGFIDCVLDGKCKGLFLSEGTDVFVITPNRQTFFFPETERQPSCPYKPLSIQNLRYLQFLSNFQTPKFKFSVSGKKNVHLFGVMTKTSVPYDKNEPLQ